MADSSQDLCKSCKAPVVDAYCPSCGQPKVVQRINGRYIFSEVTAVLNLDKGFFYTVKELIVNPGKNIRSFLAGSRKKLVKPVVYIIFCSLFYTIMQRISGFQDSYINVSDDTPAIDVALISWLSKNYGFMNIFISFFVAVWIKLFTRKKSYHYFELVVLCFYLIGTMMLIAGSLSAISTITSDTVKDIGIFGGMLFVSWGVACFIERKTLRGVIIGFFSFILGFISFTLLITGIGSLGTYLF